MRVRGQPYRGELFPFASVVVMRCNGKLEGADLRARWCEAVWLGKQAATDEHLGFLCREDKLVRARAARDAGQRPRAEDIMKIRSGILETLRRNSAAGEVSQDRPEDGPPGVRRINFNITRQFLEIIGFTENCPKCRDVQNGNVQPWLAHSQQC